MWLQQQETTLVCFDLYAKFSGWPTGRPIHQIVLVNRSIYTPTDEEPSRRLGSRYSHKGPLRATTFSLDYQSLFQFLATVIIQYLPFQLLSLSLLPLAVLPLLLPVFLSGQARPPGFLRRRLFKWKPQILRPA
jgi:hypothetical protein